MGLRGKMPDRYKAFTVDDFEERLHYDPLTGHLFHKRGRFKGKIAGSPLEDNGGYRYLCMSKDGKPYSVLAHRIIWGLYYGEFAPEDRVIDHIDGDPDNNKIDNLRVVTQEENNRNRGRRKKKVDQRYAWTSVTGIKFDKKEMCYVVSVGDEEVRTLDFDDAKYTRWGWEFDNNWSDRF
jgi:hypothetical protein